MDLNQRPQRKKNIPLRLQDPAKSEKPEPVVKKKKIDHKSDFFSVISMLE